MAKKPRRAARSTRSSARAKLPVRKQSSGAKKAAPARHRRKKPAGSRRAASPAIGAAASGMTKAEAIKLLDWVHGFTNKMVESWPADKAVYQSAPTDNHLMWTVGHLATTYGWLVGLLTGSSKSGAAGALPANYNDLFGYKSSPKANASDYPSLSEVRHHMDATYAQMLAALRAMPESDLGKPCAMDSGGFASSNLDAILKACWHDGWHQGQLSNLRRALGLPSVM